MGGRTLDRHRRLHDRGVGGLQRCDGEPVRVERARGSPRWRGRRRGEPAPPAPFASARRCPPRPSGGRRGNARRPRSSAPEAARCNTAAAEIPCRPGRALPGEEAVTDRLDIDVAGRDHLGDADGHRGVVGPFAQRDTAEAAAGHGDLTARVVPEVVAGPESVACGHANEHPGDPVGGRASGPLRSAQQPRCNGPATVAVTATRVAAHLLQSRASRCRATHDLTVGTNAPSDRAAAVASDTVDRSIPSRAVSRLPAPRRTRRWRCTRGRRRSSPDRPSS